MSYVLGFFRFWYDFIVGDCWQIGAGVVVVLACGAALEHWGVVGQHEIGPLVGAGLVLLVVVSLLMTSTGEGH